MTFPGSSISNTNAADRALWLSEPIGRYGVHPHRERKAAKPLDIATASVDAATGRIGDLVRCRIADHHLTTAVQDLGATR